MISRTSRATKPRRAGLSCFWGALCAALLVLTPPAVSAKAACAAPTVLRVHDGDTVSLRCKQGPPIKLRLAGIDAPERGQPYGRAATRALTEMLANRPLRVESRATDRYGRVIGDVIVDGKSVSERLVVQGLAWCGRRATRACKGRQREAQEARRGLWRDKAPIPPWQWRKAHPPYASTAAQSK